MRTLSWYVAWLLYVGAATAFLQVHAGDFRVLLVAVPLTGAGAAILIHFYWGTL